MGIYTIIIDEIILWLTGYNKEELEMQFKKETDFETFFKKAPHMNPSRDLIKGVVCGIRVENIEEPIIVLYFCYSLAYHKFIYVGDDMFVAIIIGKEDICHLMIQQ